MTHSFPMKRALLFLLLLPCSLLLSSCATATRVRIRSAQKTVDIVFPKNLSAASLAFDVDPATGEIRFRAVKLRSDASTVIESAAGAIGELADAAKSLTPLAR